MVGTFLFSFFLTWVQVSSDTYIVKSSAGEQRAIRVLQELERFHQLVGATLVFGNPELPELPIEVLLIGDEETMKELEPEYNGRKVAVAGYFQSGPDRDFIVLSGRIYPETLTSVVYHELTHYFVARGLKGRPTWLNEGLAEYFSTAEIRDDVISLGALSTDRLQLMKAGPMIPLKEFFAVDSSSAYYNESSKSNAYYAQAWAFMHYMMHGEHASRFKLFLKALQKGEGDLLQHLAVSERDLEIGFRNYLNMHMQRAPRTAFKAPAQTWDMNVESIPETEAKISIAEIFLANGKLQEARRHLEVLGERTPDSTRVSYYRGILARIADDTAARDFFVDALLDPFLAPRAAVQLVAMGDMHIPAVRTILEESAATKTRNPEVYLALSRIYSEDVRRIEEAVQLQLKGLKPVITPRIAVETAAETTADWRVYMNGASGDGKVAYELLSDSERQPGATLVVAPYYPPELRAEGSGEVVMDVQVTEDGKVGGLWLVSANPDIFEILATSSVRDWEFERIPAKIRVVVRFQPTALPPAPPAEEAIEPRR